MSDLFSLSDGEQLAFANLLIALKAPLEIRCDYTNWRGVVSERHLRVLGVWYGETEWHPEPSLLVHALDLDKDEERDFRLVDFDISSLRAA